VNNLNAAKRHHEEIIVPI